MKFGLSKNLMAALLEAQKQDHQLRNRFRSDIAAAALAAHQQVASLGKIVDAANRLGAQSQAAELARACAEMATLPTALSTALAEYHEGSRLGVQSPATEIARACAEMAKAPTTHSAAVAKHHDAIAPLLEALDSHRQAMEEIFTTMSKRPAVPVLASMLVTRENTRRVGAIRARSSLMPLERLRETRSRPDSPAQTLHIDVRVVCYRCGASLLAEGTCVTTTRSDIPVSLRVVPVCASCMRDWDGSAEFWVPDAPSSVLQILDGGAEGDDTPTGDLRLVDEDLPDSES